MTTRMIMEAGPVDGINLLYAGVQTGAITRSEFLECVQAIVAQAVMGIEDMEDDAVMMTTLLDSDRVSVC